MTSKSKSTPPKPPSASWPTVLLKPGEANRVLAGHPWIYRGCILRITRKIDDGAVVQVKDHRQRFLGLGLFNSRSKIQVRMLHHEKAVIDEPFFHRRIQQAQQWRARHCGHATSLRLVNSESDFLSGLIVDQYEDTLVAQFSSLGLDQRKNLIVEALAKLIQPRAILERSDIASRKFEGLDQATGVLYGESDGTLSLQLNGLRFQSHAWKGHKTGLYLDQQANYAAVAALAQRTKAQRALDAFCFQGGFALHLARAGVPHVLALDQSQDALQTASDNAAANQLSGACKFTEANVFDWFKAQTTTASSEQAPPRFDFIVLDPPSFTRNRATVPDALRGYKEIHLRALKLLQPGGTLVTFCCSHHVDEPLFLEAILAAAFDARKTLREIERYTQGPDHPILPAVPETHYLKGFAFEVHP